MDRIATRKIDRRQLAKAALGAGLVVPALGIARVGAQEGTTVPVTRPDIGEVLDLANLSPSIAAPAEETTITFASWVADSVTLQNLRDDFQALFPTIKIELENVPAEQFTDLLTTRIAGGNAPDCAYMDDGGVAAFASRNALADLTSYIAASSAVVPDDYVAAFRTAVTYENAMYGLPIDGESTGLFYRTDRFQEAGIAAAPTTWEEFRAAAEALTTTEGDERRYGFIIFAPEAAYYWYPWLWQAGGELLSEDGQQVLFSNEAGKRAAEFYIGLAQYSPPDFYNSNSWDGRVAFATGQVGMYVAGAWFASTISEQYPDIEGLWATAPLPQDQRCATTIAGDALVITEQSEKKDAAWKWIEFMSAPRNMAYWNLGSVEDPGSLLPPRTSLLSDPRIFEIVPILQGFAEQMACGVTNTIANPQWPEIEQALNEALGRAIYGEVDAATALDEAALEAEDIIANS